MKIVSVMNYKGGVGKTTLTANVGAQLAKNGLRVLLLDLDPQTSLTFSFFKQDEWRDWHKTKTIKQWFDAFIQEQEEIFDLDSLLHPLPKINPYIEAVGGCLQLISSHIELIDVDMNLAQDLNGGSAIKQAINYLRVFSSLRKALQKLQTKFDLVLIDCPPNFNIVTRTAIAASDWILVPTKADYISSIGFENLHKNVSRFVKEFNDKQSERPEKTDPINPEWLGIALTMLRFYYEKPTQSLQPFIKDLKNFSKTKTGIDDLVFSQFMRENSKLHALAPLSGVPVVLGEHKGRTYVKVKQELVDLSKAICSRIGL
jgi:chromosome partitioning protein